MIELVILAHLLYAKECCADKDCHPVPCDEVQDIKDGWTWHQRYFSRTMLRISEDGGCHVCFSPTASFCIYLPPRV